MNHQQKTFLIDKIKSNIDLKIRDLKSLKQSYPSASNYIFRAVMNDTIEIADKEVVKKALKERALKAKEGENWLSGRKRFDFSEEEQERHFTISINDLIVPPKEYDEEYKKVKIINEKIEEQIKELEMQRDNLILRIQLSSDKKLEKMISEVDDMGDLSLMDNKIRLLE